MNRPFSLYIANVGCVGNYASKSAALKDARLLLKSSGRADKPGSYIMDEDKQEVVHEWTRSARARGKRA